ncbi:hypothetical protein METESE_08360 [Mesoterricola sediminis]|uniref:HAD family hydrolase n=1 Tax=Mesoterricola sediminis TaxID=2927980 RepID=A0AA48KEX0_9BACT|nr:hypothetical protein METESE_08360 [Mesoterricola sediminis]
MTDGAPVPSWAARLGAPEGGVLAGRDLSGFLEALLDPGATPRIHVAGSLQGQWAARIQGAGIACEVLRLETGSVLDTLMDALAAPAPGEQVWLDLDRRLGPLDLKSLDAFLAFAATRTHPPLVVLLRDDAPGLVRTQRLAVDRQGPVLLLRESGEGAYALGAPEHLARLAARGAGGGALPSGFRRPGSPARDLLVLDIDGVLIDPGRSFHEAVALALNELAPALPWDDEHYTAFKRVGGFNNDFRLAAAALALAERNELGGLRDAAGRGGFPHLEARIQALEPLCQTAIQKHYVRTRRLERPIITRAELETFPGDVAIFTGRPPEELLLAYQVLGFRLPAVSDAAPHLRKPRPEGLLQLADAFRASRVIFVGDTCDDASALRDARALNPEVDWVFAAVGPDRQWIAAEGDLTAPRLRDLLPRLAGGPGLP